MVQGALSSVGGIAQTLIKATPLLLAGLGICIAFHGGMINIGAELFNSHGPRHWHIGTRVHRGG